MSSLRKFTVGLIAVLILQLIYGAFMAGLKAASAAPTWPTINGTWVPENFHSFGDHQFHRAFFSNRQPIGSSFIHRNLAYLVMILVFIWYWKARSASQTFLFQENKMAAVCNCFHAGIIGNSHCAEFPASDNLFLVGHRSSIYGDGITAVLYLDDLYYSQQEQDNHSLEDI